jgi:hypothetical protein
MKSEEVRKACRRKMKWGIIYMVIGGIGVLLAVWRITHMAIEQERRKKSLEKGT